MKLKKSYEAHPALDEIIGHLGQVQLVRKADGKHELVGGTTKAQAMVRCWCAVYATFLEFVGESEVEVALQALSSNWIYVEQFPAGRGLH